MDDLTDKVKLKRVEETIVHKESVVSEKVNSGTGGRGIGFAGVEKEEVSQENAVFKVEETVEERVVQREYYESNDGSSGGGTGGRGRGRTGPERNIEHNSDDAIEDNSSF